MSNLINIFTIIIIFWSTNYWVHGKEMHIDGIDNLNASQVEDIYTIYELRARKFNSSTYSLNADFEIYEDMDDQISVNYIFLLISI